MMYEVQLNNKTVYKSDSITNAVNNCLEYIGISFKSFNTNNCIMIYETERKLFVWSSKNQHII